MGAIQAIRGTRDILPNEVSYWQHAEATARTIFQRAQYQEIRTPIFEATELFARGIGEATDVVGKEMYSFTDRGDRALTLRPELTAGVARACIQNGLLKPGSLQRLWYTGPTFRYERPQAGRQRQFHQVGIECLGSDSPLADVEVIALATDLLQALGLRSLQLDINSVGRGEDRQRHRQALVDYLTPHKADLDADSQDRLTRNPLRILDSKNERTQTIVQDAPQLLDYLSPESRRHFEQVQASLNDLGIAYQINPRLVRGLDYYTHTAFEIQSADLGAQATVCGGGRYDGLVATLGGADTPAVGWALGMERLILLLQELQASPTTAPDFYVVSRGAIAQARALVLTQKLRQQGFGLEFDLSGSGFGNQFKRADRSGAIACLILGDEEAAQGKISIKWLPTQTQDTWTQDRLLTSPDSLRQTLAQLRETLAASQT
ncbi:MAG: histidine--tRNA ligase [Spirulinaceae cyanobacterium RM2_2_10]|nr:histidine--tRNA ligase [Spirulinaceae cyanobacterium SM2_1_0]NJO20453.1 histidine--tRNA ligase [Spirulinaceae cyanobacterium RM2_2_10]